MGNFDNLLFPNRNQSQVNGKVPGNFQNTLTEVKLRAVKI
jgi:hypothetical protein